MAGIGHVAEAFGKAWGAAGDRAKAIEWYRTATSAQRTASLMAVEQLANSMARARRRRSAEPETAGMT